jgi:hypothetical protein
MELNLYNNYNLGDNIFIFILFYNIKKYIEDNNIIINYYCKREYHDQLNEYNCCSKNIHILEFDDHVRNIGLNMWIGNTNDFKINYYNRKVNDDFDVYYDNFYVNFFNQFLEMNHIEQKIEKLEYNEPKLLEKYEDINRKYNNKYLDLDFLILNSTPKSVQYEKNDEDWNKLIYKLNEKYKISSFFR